jgi:hypothetical protein
MSSIEQQSQSSATASTPTSITADNIEKKAALFDPLSFAAGCIAGSTGTFFGYPLDTLKTYAQTSHQRNNIATPPYTFTRLFRGCTVPVALAGFHQSITLGLYENTRLKLRERLQIRQEEATPLRLIALAALNAGLVNSFLSHPQRHIKVVQQLDGGKFLPTALSLYKKGAVYKGLSATLIYEGLGRPIYMASYVGFKRIISGNYTGADDSPMPLWQRITAGASAKLVSWIIIYPADVIASVMMSPGHKQKVGLIETTKYLVEIGGMKALYRGFAYTMIRAGPVAGIMLPCFDLLLDFLKKLSKED